MRFSVATLASPFRVFVFSRFGLDPLGRGTYPPPSMIRTTWILLFATCWPAWAIAQPAAGRAEPFAPAAKPLGASALSQQPGREGSGRVEEAAQSSETPADSGRSPSPSDPVTDVTSPLAARIRSLQQNAAIAPVHSATGSSPSATKPAASMVSPAVAPAAGAALAAQLGVLILRNGQTIEGRICRVGDYYYVGMPDGEVRLKVAEVELMCHDLVDGYQRKRAQLPPENAAEHLRLAQWCQKVGLLEQAEAELAAARKIDARHPMLELLEQRQRLLREPPPPPQERAAAGDYEVGPEELDRMTQQLAPGVAEFFTQTVQPILVNNCMTSGCHSRPERSEYYLLRPPHDQRPGRRLTQRNLYETLKWIDANQPDQSRLMQAATNPHGGQKVAPLGPGRTLQSQMLQFFVEAATRGSQTPSADSGSQVATAPPQTAQKPSRPSLAQNPPMQPPMRSMDQGQSLQSEPQQPGFPISPMVDGRPQAGPAGIPVGSSVAAKATTVARWAGGQEHEKFGEGGVGRRAAASSASIGAVSEAPPAVEPRRISPMIDSSVRPAAYEEPSRASARFGQPLRQPIVPAAAGAGVSGSAGRAPAGDPFDPAVFNQKYFPNNRSASRDANNTPPSVATESGG